MYTGRRRDQWCHTASLMALVANCHRDPRRMRRPFDLIDFLPPDLRVQFRRSTGLRLTPHNLRMLKPLFNKK
ncbi:MAG: hypothetical protein D6744_15455 [Planctomycetota bacterium]|nr:MAG: hypothetical protein D6744_15455 [Planctomycetota bacterium]